MADDSRKVEEPLDFHPCNTPRGMTYYKLEDLTTEQKRKLFEQKLDIVRENQKYLNKHPEVRAVIALVLRAVLKARPKIKLRYFLAKYFVENFDKIKATIESFATPQSSTEMIVDDNLIDDNTESDSFSSSSSIDSDEPSFLCVIEGQSSYDLLPKQARGESKPETLLICSQILEEIISYVCRHDIVQQIKMISGTQSKQYDSDPMLAFPYENYSLASFDDNSRFECDETTD
ncbi:uncharacterized protein [Leptinotarsa decemlineata]|uniref:uncharacterized protein n=1 Tax=Leptinotarsa decemlineata TaxID=7539 RepID=UPI003D3091D5